MSQKHIEEIENRIFGQLPFKAKAKDIKLIIEYAKEQAERALKNADDLHVMDLQLASEQKEIKRLQDENETLFAANNDLLHEIRVLKNQINDQTNLRILEFKVQNKQLLKQNKRYRATINAMGQILKDAIHALDVGEKVQGLEYGVKIANDALESESHE